MGEIKEGYRRVTDIIKPFSGLQHVDPYVLDKAALRGTKVHSVCEAIMRGVEDWDTEVELRGYVESFKQWWVKGHKVHSIEKRLYCDTYMLSGQIDVLLEEGENLTVLDLKTPLRESKTWALQGAAYAYLARKNGLPVSKIQILQLNKHGMPPILREYKDEWQTFKKCLEIHDYFHKRRSKEEKTDDE